MSRRKIPLLERIEATIEDLLRIKERLDTIPQLGDDARILKATIDTMIVFKQFVEEKIISFRRFKQMLFGSSTEKTRNVLKPDKKGTEEQTGEPEGESRESESRRIGDTPVSQDQENKTCKGHGRNGADKYTGAQRIRVPHETLKHGDRCPECEKGIVYNKKIPGTILHLVGQPPVGAIVYEQEKLRCNLCGETFAAELPEQAKEKYDETAASMIGLVKYGCGFPFNRLEKLQENLGIPLPASTQWDIEEKAGNKIYPGFEELKRQGAQADIVYNDDTTMKILDLMRENAQRESNDDKNSSRTGMFTTGVIAEKDGRKIALFFTGRNHAGENLEELLKHRMPDRGPPIQMCDAASKNAPTEFQVILSNCNTHARRKFVDIAWCFPDECAYVIETYKKVYTNDALTKEQLMSPEARLQFHQMMNKPLMDELETWLHEQIDKKKVEPNSSLGESIRYMIKHWNALTQFLRVPNAPLDSNVVERALKIAIINRKNAYFYRTEHGAYIGDMFMSLIHTCNLNGVNPFDYLTHLQRHAAELKKDPAAWMPWSYQQTLQALAA